MVFGRRGAYGLNFEWTSDHGFGIYNYETAEDAPSIGFLVGGSAEVNVAVGSGGWTGPFRNISGAYGIFGGGVFQSVPGSGGQYTGIAGGFSFGPPGLGGTITNYAEGLP